MTTSERARILFIFCLFAAVFCGFSWRLVHIQIVEHEHFTRLAARKHVKQQTIHASRGSIYDARGELLAGNVPVRTIVADASLVRDPQAVADAVGRHLGLKPGDVLDKLATGSRYIVLARKVPEITADALADDLRALGQCGMTFEPEEIRIYPNDSMLCHVVGFTNYEMRGMDGIERAMDEYLVGRDGYRFIEKDRTGREIVLYRGAERAPVNGCDVYLTIDMGLQQIIEDELDALVQKYTPESASIILMEPRTGAILALANRPHYSPESIEADDLEAMKNRAVINMVEPGSTFKIVAAGAALNEGFVEPDTLIFCENGRFHYGGKSLRDHHPYGELTVSDILVKSSNIGSAKLAIQLGELKFYEYIRRYGFGEKTGIDLPGEIGGMLHPVPKWSKISITRLPMGHEIGVTPVQMVAAMSVIANGGILVRPHVVRSVVDSEGRLVKENKALAVRRVLQHRVARQISSALADVVSDRGTAKLAKVEGFRVAGKTGTAQKVDPNGGYTPGKYVVSFLGYLPEEDPRFVGLVIVDDPHTEPGLCYGGTVAAPVFASMAARAMRYLDVEPPPPPVEGTYVLSQTATMSQGGRP